MLILLVRLRHFLLRMEFGKKIAYLVLGLGNLVCLLLGFGPFLCITDPSLDGGGAIVCGFDFFAENAAGDFVVLAGIGVSLIILSVLVGLIIFFIPGIRGERSTFWFLTFWGAIALLGFAVPFNYYLFGFALGQQSDGVSIAIGWAGIAFDLILVLSWIAFFVLRHIFLSTEDSEPLFGTGLDGK